MVFSTKEMQELSRLTLRASIDNDIETLKALKKKIEKPDPEGLKQLMGNEWFYSLLTAEQMHALSSK